MPTSKPRFNVTISQELLDKVNEYRFANRCRSQTQAINELIIRGIKELNPQPTAGKQQEPVTMDGLTEMEVEFMETFDALTEQNQRLLLGIGAVILQEQQKPPD